MGTWAVWTFGAAGLVALFMAIQWARLWKKEHRSRSICNQLSEKLARVVLFYDGKTQKLIPVITNFDTVFGFSEKEGYQSLKRFKKYLCQQTEPNLFDKMD